MRYSIYNWNSRQYDLFDSSTGEQPGQRPTPRRKVNAPQGRGHQLESLVPVLPRNAVAAGSSPTPQGRVAIHWSSSATGLGADDSPLVTHPWLTLGVIVGAVFVGHRLLLATARRM